ncbi:ABC transporter permease [Nocardioides sp. cx-169]|uniref:ABC transporter permease n=1 Tax=Nocardioides sp. cx-169 TaxID=2899080 RepID=UPI001E3788A4|nr:ABC transporter permease [Nocardioides sp. cx-169]MCD4535809.1 ABC transporter permease [Nocardioides sp. cx-169]
MTVTLETQTGEVAKVRGPADVRRQVKMVVLFALVTLALAIFYLDIQDPTVRYLLDNTPGEEPQEANAKVVVAVAFALSLVALVLAALNKLPPGALTVAAAVLVGLAFLVGFIVWNYADQSGPGLLTITNPLPGTVKYAVPLVFGALAGTLCERAGVINIAIEGQFLMAAFFAAVVASFAGRAEYGLVGGIAAGVAMAALLAVFAMRYRVNQVVLGVVLIALATGLTDFLLSQIPSDPDVRDKLNNPQTLGPLPDAGIPFLSSVADSLTGIPVLGPTVFNQTLLAYLMYVSVIVVAFVLFQTRWGLRVRSVGEHPKAADTVGLKVNRLRWQAVLLGGVFAGLGGAYFTVGSNGAFASDMSAGNGFIALAAVIMGRWHPVYATFAALFFGLMTTLSFQLKFIEKVPTDLLVALPYLATIIAVAGLVGRVRPPAADGEPYVKS